jgi:hypothetical protein
MTKSGLRRPLVIPLHGSIGPTTILSNLKTAGVSRKALSAAGAAAPTAFGRAPILAGRSGARAACVSNRAGSDPGVFGAAFAPPVRLILRRL